MKPLIRSILPATLLVVALPTAPAATVDFARDIQPILETSCVNCHGPVKQRGKLRLDTREAVFKGGDHATIVPKDTDKSELFQRIILPKGDDDLMPKDADPLPKEQIDLIRDWINSGAEWPEGLVLKDRAELAQPKDGPQLPEDFKASAAEQTAVKKLAESGLQLHPIAMNSPWREANLRLRGAEVTDATVAGLKPVQSLIALNLATTRISDAGLASLKGLPHLQKLNLSQTEISDAGLAHLSGLTNLTYLNVYATAVSDAGLEHLKNLQHLRKLYVWQTKVTDAGIAKLKETLPNVDVVQGYNPPPPAPKEEAKKEEAKQ